MNSSTDATNPSSILAAAISFSGLSKLISGWFSVSESNGFLPDHEGNSYYYTADLSIQNIIDMEHMNMYPRVKFRLLQSM